MYYLPDCNFNQLVYCYIGPSTVIKTAESSSRVLATLGSVEKDSFEMTACVVTYVVSGWALNSAHSPGFEMNDTADDVETTLSGSRY